MANTYEQETMNLPAEASHYEEPIRAEEPIIVKGGTHPPEPMPGVAPIDIDYLRIDLGNLFTLGWKMSESTNVTTITIDKNNSKWVFKVDGDRVILERLNAHFGNLKLSGFGSTSNPYELKPYPHHSKYHKEREIKINVVRPDEP